MDCSSGMTCWMWICLIVLACPFNEVCKVPLDCKRKKRLLLEQNIYKLFTLVQTSNHESEFHAL